MHEPQIDIIFTVSIERKHQVGDSIGLRTNDALTAIYYVQRKMTEALNVGFADGETITLKAERIK